MDSRIRGFTLVDSLIAVFVLSIGVVLYSKNWAANFGAKNSTHSRSIAATQVAEIGNILLANVADLDRATPRGQVIARVGQFANQLDDHLNGFSKAKAYECKLNTPQVLAAASGATALAKATLPRAWSQGASSCINITLLPNIKTQTNGVWVQIESSWIDSHTRKGELESVRVYTLVSPL